MRRSWLGIAVAPSLLLLPGKSEEGNGVAAALPEAQPTKVGWVDSNEILVQYPRYQEAQKALEASLQGYGTEVQQLNADMQAAVEEYQQQQLTMTPEARQSREEELRNRQRSIQQRTQQLEAEAQQRRAEVLQPVMEAITAVIEEIRVEGSYAMILDSASQAIISADPALELTQEVLDRLERSGGSGSEPGR